MQRRDIDSFLAERISPYRYVQYIYDPDKGYIVWRRGTGDNMELLHIRTFEKRKGYGRELFYRMLDELRRHPPYFSMFGFTIVGNKEAQAFYGALGFNLQRIDGLYKDGEAVMFWQSFETLKTEQEKWMEQQSIKGKYF